MPHLKKAELIDGVVYMPSPVNHRQHGNPHFNMISWLSVYAGVTPGIEGGDNSSLRLDILNEPQPDAFLMVSPEYGGQVQIDSDGYIAGGPELVAEVAATSANYDLGSKLKTYQRNNVHEYIVWRVFDREVDWFIWRSGQFESLPLEPDGTYRSQVFPGLWLNRTDLIAGNLNAIVLAAPQILERPGHAEFVARLRQNKKD